MIAVLLLGFVGCGIFLAAGLAVVWVILSERKQTPKD